MSRDTLMYRKFGTQKCPIWDKYLPWRPERGFGFPCFPEQFCRFRELLLEVFGAVGTVWCAAQAQLPSPLPVPRCLSALPRCSRRRGFTGNLPLMFYENTAANPRGTHVPLEYHFFADAGEGRDPEGNGRKAVVAYVGELGTPSGAFLSKTAKVRDGANTVADELEAYSEAVKFVIAARQLSEEIAGLRMNVYDTAGRVTGSAPPTAVLAGTFAVQAVSKGWGARTTGLQARSAAIERMQEAAARRLCYGATAVSCSRCVKDSNGIPQYWHTHRGLGSGRNPAASCHYRVGEGG